MRTFPILTAFFIGVPLIEIFLFIKVGGAIGALPTVALVVVTAVVGVALLRAQGMQTMATFQQRIAKGEMPADTMLEGAALLFGGALLLTPGFLTDAVGFLCLLPVTRQPLVRWIMSHFVLRNSVHMYSGSARNDHNPNVIEGEYRPRKGRHDDP